jgi:MerR family transcriptional regulator, copper efflux regulator
MSDRHAPDTAAVEPAHAKLRLYEKAGILPTSTRTAAGYRVYRPDTIALLGFVAHARRLGFRLEEIKSILALKRSGQTPCSHVSQLDTSPEARELGRLARAAVREAREGLQLQAKSGPLSDQVLDQIVHRAAIPLLERLRTHSPEVVAGLLPNILRLVLFAALEPGEE